MTPVFYAWLAGLLEGEACFRAYNGYPIIALLMTDEDFVAKVAAAFGRKHYATNHSKRPLGHKQLFRVSITGRHAAGWMMTLYPFLGARRRAKIREVLEIWRQPRLGHFQRDKVACKYGHPYTAENTYIYASNGARGCRACHRIYQGTRYRTKPLPTPGTACRWRDEQGRYCAQTAPAPETLRVTK